MRSFELTGIARFGDVDSLGGATIALFDVATARQVLDKSGFDAIAVGARDGVGSDELLAAIDGVLPPSAEVKTGAQQADEDGEGVGEFVTFIRYFLLAFGGIALFVGAFVIFNTLSITVAQRTKELATLRTLGASRRQVLRSVVLEGAVLGVVASAIGLGLGVALAKGLTALFKAVDLEMPQAAMVFQTRTAVVAMLTGTLVTRGRVGLAGGAGDADRADRGRPRGRHGREAAVAEDAGRSGSSSPRSRLPDSSTERSARGSRRRRGCSGSGWGPSVSSSVSPPSRRASSARSPTSSASRPRGSAARRAGSPARTRSATPAAPPRPRRR